ncbi:MAG: hypothetical protein HWE27_14480 [Gammaproteobacteria bacterium]|nr:hypothetical protein [Gammaproteobacteria bacterium]
MPDIPLPALIALELTLLLNLILGGALWFTFRELKNARKRFMRARRDVSKLKRQSTSETEQEDNSRKLSLFLEEQLAATDLYLESLQSETEASESDDGETDSESEPGAENPTPDLSSIDASASDELKMLAIRRHFIQQELESLEDEKLNFDQWLTSIKQFTNELFPQTKESSHTQAPKPEGNMTGETESEHYKNLYDELLITLQRSKETIRSLALRLADIIDDGMDEEQLNALIVDLNKSMDAFGELSGITASSAVEQLEDEVKAIRHAYEQGMNLMEHFEKSVQYIQQLSDAIEEHSSTIELNRNNYEAGEPVDSDKVLSNNKRYARMIEGTQLIHQSLTKEVENAKTIIGDFIAMTRNFQDQSTRIIILQSREKQLNSDLRQLRMSQQEALSCLQARDLQLSAMFKKYKESLETEYNEKIVTLATEVYKIEQEILAIDNQESTSALRKQKGELVQKRLALEGQIIEASGGG